MFFTNGNSHILKILFHIEILFIIQRTYSIVMLDIFLYLDFYKKNQSTWNALSLSFSFVSGIIIIASKVRRLDLKCEIHFRQISQNNWCLLLHISLAFRSNYLHCNCNCIKFAQPFYNQKVTLHVKGHWSQTSLLKILKTFSFLLSSWSPNRGEEYQGK